MFKKKKPNRFNVELNNKTYLSKLECEIQIYMNLMNDLTYFQYSVSHVKLIVQIHFPSADKILLIIYVISKTTEQSVYFWRIFSQNQVAQSCLLVFGNFLTHRRYFLSE